MLVLTLCLARAQVYFQHGICLSADGPHYFVQARSLLFDDDLGFANDYERVRAPRPIAERYPVGMGLLSLPFLLLTHLMVLFQSGEADGFGYAYETGFGLGSYFLGSLGLLFVLGTASRFFPTGMSLLSLVTLWASSFLLWYMVIEPAGPCNSTAFALVSCQRFEARALLISCSTSINSWRLCCAQRSGLVPMLPGLEGGRS